MRQIAIYSVGRLAVFVVLAAVLWLLGLDGFLLFGVALALSMPVSYLVLNRQLAGVTRVMQERQARRAELRAQLRGEQ